MAQTCIKFEACKASVSEAHNQREKELDYLICDSSNNESYKFLDCDLSEIRLACKNDYESFPRGKNQCTQDVQKNWEPLREAVVRICETTTMEDIIRLCRAIHQKYGMEPIQAHIHRDEGYIVQTGDSKGEIIMNLHAHLVFCFYNPATHRNYRYTKSHMSEMQTLTAEVLGMERGQHSNKKHLSALQYKIKKETELLDGLHRDVKKLRNVVESTKEAMKPLVANSASELDYNYAAKKKEFSQIIKASIQIDEDYNQQVADYEHSNQSEQSQEEVPATVPSVQSIVPATSIVTPRRSIQELMQSRHEEQVAKKDKKNKHKAHIKNTKMGY